MSTSFPMSMDDFISHLPPGPLRREMTVAFDAYLRGRVAGYSDTWEPKTVRNPRMAPAPTAEDLEAKVARLTAELEAERGRNYPWP